MIDRIIYKIFGWLDDFCNFFYDKFICDKSKKKKK